MKRLQPAWGVLASALLCGVCARGGIAWVLIFFALVPWLRSLDDARSFKASLFSGWAMSVAFGAAVFAWFGLAIGRYADWGGAAGVAVLLLVAPLLQPQFIVFALVRQLAGRHHGPLLRALAAAAAWVATEAVFPKLLGDTYSLGLHPSRLLRQAADLGGTAGLTLLLLLSNEALSAALAARPQGLRAAARPLAAAAAVPIALAAYGLAVMPDTSVAAGQGMRIGLVQSNIVDYDRLRREKGAAAVVREVLDVHFAMSYDAIERQHADAVLWSETVYPTTFGHPKSEAGAELDREILDIVNAAGVPFVFGTYDRDAQGEYNAAAFVQPGRGLLGLYRKTRLFPFTEQVPAWADSAALRRALPWLGNWRPGDGARVFPLRLRDGREVPVLPLICLDDVDARLAVDGARLGAQAILTMSNDSWFSDDPLGAQLHQAAAAFRSVETRLPQYRVTSNGYSGVIDATGSVIAGTRMGERTLVIGDLPARTPPRTLRVAWGDWVGRGALVFLALLAVASALRGVKAVAPEAPSPSRVALPADVLVLPPAARAAAALLRVFARGSLLWMVAAVLLGEGLLKMTTLAQIRSFSALVLAPEAAAACLLAAFSARATMEDGSLVLARGGRRLTLALSDVAALVPWRLPLPRAGADVLLASGERWRYGLAHPDPVALARALGVATRVGGSRPEGAYAQARVAMRKSRLDATLVKFVLLPFALAVPAFHLHEHIAYGSGFGELYSFGLKAWLTTFALWWAAWCIGVVLCAAALRAGIEAGTVLAALLRPAQAAGARRWLERLGLGVLYVGLPAWLVVRLLSS